jgi:primosomal protein N''
MTKQHVVKQLQENIKIIYHTAVDADKHLQVLREQDKATFTQVFKAETIFRNHSNTFLPYVEEIAADLQAIETDTEEHYQKLLPEIVIKIELLFKMLNSLKNIEK